MKFVKHIISFALVLAMLISCLPMSFAEEAAVQTAPWTSGSNAGPLDLVKNPVVQPEYTGFATPENSPAVEAETDDVITADNVTAEDLTSKYSQLVERFNAIETGANYKAGDQVTFIVVMEEEPLLEAGFQVEDIAANTLSVQSYQGTQMSAMAAAQAELSGNAAYEMGFVYTVATTGFSVTTDYANLAKLESLPGVEKVYPAPMFSLPSPVQSGSGLQPMTGNAPSMIGADVLNESGYTGIGTKICILDTGIVVNHPNFQALPEEKLTDASLTREGVEEIWDTLNASQTNLLNVSYQSSKLPFVFNYVGMNFDVGHHTAGSDHGTHVAGISAANKIDSSEVIGVAPDAQLVIMQVFGGNGAGWDTILAAMEDAVRLDVDSVNLSLGSTAGFTAADEAFLEVMDLFAATDIEVLIAAGNDTNNAYMNVHGLNMSTADSPDIGLAGTPSTYAGALSVASVNNDGNVSLYFTVNDRQIGFNDTATTTATQFYANFGSQSLEFVTIGGFGTPADYEGVDVAGKVAVVSRGSSSFPEKQAAAQEAGAIACVVYNNAPGLLAMQINDGGDNIPCVAISQADGQFLVELGEGELTLCDGDTIVSKVGTAVSDFSSWGVTPDLKLKPELAGVGGNIYSTRDPSIAGSNYGMMSGTSMATPQVSGAAAVLLEYLRANTDLEEGELRRVAANLMMSTANPLMTSGDLEYSPRAQGAGLIDLVKATTTGAYLTNPMVEEGRPKAELGDDDDKVGVYTFSFDIVNYAGDEALSYTFDPSVFTETLYAGAFIANSPTALGAEVRFLAPSEAGECLKYDFNGNGKITTADARALLLAINGLLALDVNHRDHMDVNGDGTADMADVELMVAYAAGIEVDVDMLATGPAYELVEIDSATVEPGARASVTVEITLTDDDKTYLDESFPMGMFVEGYVHVLAADENGVDLVLPFVGYYGDWSDPVIFDTADNYNLYPLRIWNWYNMVGTNPYIMGGRSGDEYNAFSYGNPLDAIEVGARRNMRDLDISVTNVETGEVYWTLDGSYLTKTMYSPNYGQIIPFTLLSSYGEMWDGRDAKGDMLPDGTTVCYKLEAYLDDGDDIVDDVLSFNITLDDQAPEVLNQFTLQEDLMVRIQDNHVLLPLTIQENEHVAAVMFISPEGAIMGKFEVENVPGVADDYLFDITGYGNEFTILVADYACNETEFDVLLDLGDYTDMVPAMSELDPNRLYGCETFDAAAIEPSWFSVNIEDFSDIRNETYDSANRYYSAEYVNGYIVAQNANTGHLELVTPTNTYWKTQVISQNYGAIGDYGVWVLYDMALDHSGTLKGLYNIGHSTEATDSLLAVGWLYRGDSDNDGKDDGYNALFNIEFTTWGSVNVSEVAQIVGTSNGGEILCLGITTEGEVYGIGTDGILYSIPTETTLDEETWRNVITVEPIGATDFVSYPGYGGTNVIQSMGYDHNTDTMYWYAHSQVLNSAGTAYNNVNVTYSVNLETAECTEIGTYGPGGQTCLFVPNDLESDLFEMGVQAQRFSMSEWQLNMAQGQTQRVRVNYEPWNAAPVELTWTSADETIATVNEYGIVTAVAAGQTTITASGIVMLDGWWDWNVPGGEYHEPALGTYEASCMVNVVPSQDQLIGFVLDDFGTTEPDLAWMAYHDAQTSNIATIRQHFLPGYDENGNPTMVEAIWQGGAYFDGYVYTTHAHSEERDGVVYSGTALYKSKVTKGEDGELPIIGDPEYIGFSEGVEISAMAFDYTTSRMYCVENRNVGGLGIMDLDTGVVDMMGVYNGDLTGAIYTPSIACLPDGSLVMSDAIANLYTLDPDTLTTKCIYQGNGDPNTAYYEAMYYDYDTGNLYWNLCEAVGNAPLYIVQLPQTEWDQATLIDLGGVHTKKGGQQTVIFAIPDNEPEARVLPVESIEITNGESILGLHNGTAKLNTVTVPARPTIQAKTWTSSNEDVVTVDRYGNLEYVGVGEATVTVSITNKDEATYGGPFTDSIKVTVLESAGEFVAFLNSDTNGGSGYYDFWLYGNDYDLRHTEVGESMIAVYSLRTGTYYDGYYYAYAKTGEFMRIDVNDPNNYKVLGNVNLESDYQVTGMTFDYTTGTMYGLTLPSRWNANDYAEEQHPGELVTIDLDTGLLTTVATLDYNTPVYALACDADGVLYAVGGTEYSLFADHTNLYTVDKTTGELSYVLSIPGAGLYTETTYYSSVNYNSQLTYDFGTDRLYLNATVSSQNMDKSHGMFMVQLGDEPMASYLDGISLYMRGDVKYGEVFLGLLAFLPEAEEVPVTPVNGIILSKNAGRVAVGGTAQLEARVRPANAADPSLTWTSSDESVATVDANGLVTGVSAGSVEITVTSNETGLTAVCAMEVVAIEGEQSVAYTLSANRDALISFNPQLPAQTAEVVATVSGGGTVVGMAYVDNSLYYVADENYGTNLYRFDLNTKTSSYVTQLSTFVTPTGFAYDAENELFYVSAGFYLFQYQKSAIQQGGYTNYSNYIMDSDYCSLAGVAVIDGAVYTVGNDYYNSIPTMVCYSDKYLTSRTVVLQGFQVALIQAATDFTYDPSSDLFYFADAGHNIYQMATDRSGDTWTYELKMVDMLGDGIDIHGFGIKPAAE